MNFTKFMDLMQGPFLIAMIIALLIGYGILVLNLLTYQSALKQVRTSNQLTSPGKVWLMLIPIFSMIYAFILYPRISDSLKNEYASRGISESGDFGRKIGIAMAILGLCGFIPVVGGLASIANLVLLIIFWSKIGGYRTRLRNVSSSNGVIDNIDILD